MSEAPRIAGGLLDGLHADLRELRSEVSALRECVQELRLVIEGQRRDAERMGAIEATVRRLELDAATREKLPERVEKLEAGSVRLLLLVAGIAAASGGGASWIAKLLGGG